MTKIQLQQELEKLKEKRLHRIHRKLLGVLAVVASNNGLTIEQLLQKNYKDFVDKKRKEITIEVDKQFKRKIVHLEDEIKAQKDEPTKAVVKLDKIKKPMPKIQSTVTEKPKKSNK